jgi:chromate transporter
MGEPRRSSALEVFLVFLRLGCTSFGGPIAHLGYFQQEFVERRKWCSQATYGELIALAQSLPGPASSQVGFALGILRAGWLGGLAAWLGFTLPSAVLMLAFAYGQATFAGAHVLALLHGLQLVAVAVVAQAIVAMQRTLAPDLARIAVATAASALVLFTVSQFATLAAILLGAIAGRIFFYSPTHEIQEPIHLALPKAAGVAAGVSFLFLLGFSAVFSSSPSPSSLGVFSAFYRSGALVFGGGHVVLPLLETTVVAPGWVDQPTFLAGYGAAQAVPGPLFSFAAYLGANIGFHSQVGSPLLLATLALLSLFAPGLLAVAAILPFWSTLRANPSIRAALTGMNAAVVGILLAALYRPLWTATIHAPSDFCIAVFAFALLVLWKTPSWLVVAAVASISVGLSFLRR